MIVQQLSYLLLVVLTFSLIGCADFDQRPTSTPASMPRKLDSTTQPDSRLQPETEEENSPSELLTVRGETAYVGALQYEVDYATAKWQFIENFDPNPLTSHDERLQFRQNSACTIGLFNGPMQRLVIGEIELAGRRWMLSPETYTPRDPTQATVSHITYATKAIDPIAHEIQYYLTVFIPSPYDASNKSICQLEAEKVISTFRITDSVKKN